MGQYDGKAIGVFGVDQVLDVVVNDLGAAEVDEIPWGHRQLGRGEVLGEFREFQNALYRDFLEWLDLPIGLPGDCLTAPTTPDQDHGQHDPNRNCQRRPSGSPLDEGQGHVCLRSRQDCAAARLDNFLLGDGDRGGCRRVGIRLGTLRPYGFRGSTRALPRGRREGPCGVLHTGRSVGGVPLCGGVVDAWRSSQVFEPFDDVALQIGREVASVGAQA